MKILSFHLIRVEGTATSSASSFDSTNEDKKVVRAVMSDLLTKCEENLKKENAKTMRRGNNHRERHSIIKKSNVIDEVELEELTIEEIAEKYSINRSMVRNY